MVKITKPLSDRIKKLQKAVRQKTSYPKTWIDIYAGSGEVAMSMYPLLSSVFTDIAWRYFK